jgi:hypothetical protein
MAQNLGPSMPTDYPQDLICNYNIKLLMSENFDGEEREQMELIVLRSI